MAGFFQDLVRDTTTTTGTGNITLSGTPPTGFVSMDTAYPVTGQKFYYEIRSTGSAEFEGGEGTKLTSTTFSRRAIRSSNGNGLVSFSAGTKDFYVTISAEYMNRTITIGNTVALALAMP